MVTFLESAFVARTHNRSACSPSTCGSDYVLNIEFVDFRIFLPQKFFFLTTQGTHFWGDLTDVSINTATLVVARTHKRFARSPSAGSSGCVLGIQFSFVFGHFYAKTKYQTEEISDKSDKLVFGVT